MEKIWHPKNRYDKWLKVEIAACEAMADDFKELLLDDRDIMENLEKEEIDEIFNLDYHFKHVEDIFDRVFH